MQNLKIERYLSSKNTLQKPIHSKQNGGQEILMSITKVDPCYLATTAKRHHSFVLSLPLGTELRLPLPRVFASMCPCVHVLFSSVMCAVCCVCVHIVHCRSKWHRTDRTDNKKTILVSITIATTPVYWIHNQDIAPRQFCPPDHKTKEIPAKTLGVEESEDSSPPDFSGGRASECTVDTMAFSNQKS